VIKKSFTDRQREGEISKKIYDLIHFYLNFLEKGDFNEKINLNIKLDIYWKIIHWMGYQPGVFQCFNCGKKIEELDFYSFFIPYGVACEKCCKKENGSFAQEIKIDKNSLKILRFFLVNPVGAAAKVDIPLISVKKIEKIIKLTLERVIEKRVDL
jgi:recombinational DNA repair protein (RecF pathway)